MLLAFQEALIARGELPLHCSAAVAPGDAGATAFLAPAGTGKSTTLARAVRAGWDPVCEDTAWFDPVSGRLFGWDLGLRLLPDALHELGSVVSDPVPGEAKRLVRFGELEHRFGVRYRPSAPLSRVVLLRRSDGPAQWSPMERVVAVSALWEAAGLPLTQRARGQVAAQIAGLSGRVSLATLHLGAEVDAFVPDAW